MGYFTENLLGNPKKWTFHKHMAYGGAAGESAEGVPGGAVVIAAGVGP
jgi:hypothetical protein